MKKFLFPTLLALLIPVAALAVNSASNDQPTEVFLTAKVFSIQEQPGQSIDGEKSVTQNVRLVLTSGPDAGANISLQNNVLNNREDMRLSVGETVALDQQTKSDGKVEYSVAGKYRVSAIIWLTVIFVVLSVVIGGITGITSIVGLAVSVGIIVWFVIPRIVGGSDPLTTSLIGCVLIACTSLYLAHGFNKRTSIAFLSTIVTLFFSTLMAIWFVSVSKLFGMGTEESLYLQQGPLQNVDLKGLLLGGIIIGCLGVLDDVTTAQTAAIDEISKANPNLTAAELRKAGKSVGKEHIASLINTLALAYVGASMPLLLLLRSQNDTYPLWMTVNSEFFAEEIIRTLVGSATLLVAVPIATWFAAYFLQGGKGGKSMRGGHSHHHREHLHSSSVRIHAG